MSAKRQLLVVDDEPDIAFYLKDLLEGEGYAVLSATSGREALELAESHKIDIMITDIRMPQMDGIELLDSISHFDRDIQTIVMTGHGEMDTAIEAMKRGSLNYLKKPINYEELLITIRHGLNLVELREALERKTNELIESNEKLKKALSEIKQLSRFLPICSSCKKIRDEEGGWQRLEAYIETHTESVFSHSLCPECGEKLYGNETWFQDYKKNQEG